jgi:hypothetical protein
MLNVFNMPLSKLSIFSKNTDANETLKGYEYQKLRTLENWLHNKVNHADEIIYCEYEDDIFQRDIVAGTSKFTQLKLYGSKAFSFKSEEILKAIANFFMLFVKGEYSFDSVQFVFETNTSIAEKYKDNDAPLLQSWFDNQDRLAGTLLDQCAVKLKSVITDYVGTQYQKAQDADKSAAQLALIEFSHLPDTIWQDFAKSIRWIFNDTDSNKAMEIVTENARGLISRLPFPSVGSNAETVYATLYYEVSEKMFQDEPNQRLLNNERMDMLLLDLGDDPDKRYKTAFEAWHKETTIDDFRLGEFLEVLHSANHCRRATHIKDHTEKWAGLLNRYILHPDTPGQFRQSAIYELLWLVLRPEGLRDPDGTLKGQEALIRDYYAQSQYYTDHESAGQQFTLLQIIRAAILMDKCNLTMEETGAWLEAIVTLIAGKVSSVANNNEKCYWLELEASAAMNPLGHSAAEVNIDHVIAVYEKIVQLLPEAQLYNVSRLYDRIDQIIKIFITLKNDRHLIERLESFGDRLLPFASARFGKHETAKIYRERGAVYLRSGDSAYLSKALSCFHKAKDLWLADETIEGYILALLLIAEIYSFLNMHLAARYYAMTAAWYSIDHPERFAKRIASAYARLVTTDFMQGSWMNALDNFFFYMRSRIDFDNRALDEKDRTFMRTVTDVTGILVMAPIISPQLHGYIEFKKQRMGGLFPEIIEPLFPAYEAAISIRGLKGQLERNVSNSPINDIGDVRTIEWRAFGSVWKVSFPNNWVYNSLGEEYVSFLQILLVELSMSSIDLHFMRTTIEIEIIQAEKLQQPEQVSSNNSFKWKVFTGLVDTTDKKKIQFQLGALFVNMKFLLRDISMVKDDEVFQLLDNLIMHEGLAEKTRTINLYQRIYRQLYTEESFNAAQRNIFSGDMLSVEVPETEIMKWNNAASPLYNHQQSLEHIEGRYENTLKGIHLTLDHLKQQHRYNDWLVSLRIKGWLDWQIMMSMYNHIFSYKASQLLKNKSFKNDKEARAEMQKTFDSIKQQDESENYIQFPLSYFSGREFEVQLHNTGHLVLHTWGLENKANFPNFPAERDLLNHRFNFNIDDVPVLSAL